MPSLPAQGGSSGTWGTQLNEFLTVALEADGDVKDAALGSGTPDATKYLRGDRVWATPAGAAPTYFNVKDPAYGAVGDAVTDDTDALAAAYADAAGNQGTVLFPPGDYLTGTITWAGQSFIGVGYDSVRIRGKPSQDVFIGDQTGGVARTDGAHISGVEILVDDSVDASGSFSRGGVGNAAFAFPHADGADTSYNIRFSNMTMENVLVETLSNVVGGQNASCGFYCQAPANLSRFRHIYTQRLKYGWYDSYPSANLTLIEHFGDHNHWDSMYFNGCGTAWRMVNNANSTVTNLVIHGGVNGFNGLGVTSQNRANNSTLTFNGVFIEDCSGDAWVLSGTTHVVNGADIFGATQNALTISSSYSHYTGLNVWSGDTNNAPCLTVSGSYNNLRGVTYANNLTVVAVVTDTGTNNAIQTLNQLKTGADSILLPGGNAVVAAATGNLYLDTNTAGNTINLRTSGNAASLQVLTNGDVKHNNGNLGFFAKAPVGQPAANADTSGATLVQLETEVNEVKAALRSLGLIAT